LARALVNEEAAERAKAFDYLLKTMQQRLQALEEALRNLISSSIEKLRLELLERLRELEVKFEEHKVWTILQLNIIVKVDLHLFLLNH